MKDEAQSVGKCGLWLCAFKGWRELKFKAFVGFELKLASFWLWLKGWGFKFARKTCAGFCRHLCRHSRVLYELVCEWLCGLLLLAGLRALLQKLVAGFIATLAKGLRALRVGFLLA